MRINKDKVAIRESGRTTGLVLQAISRAILNPGHDITFLGDYPETEAHINHAYHLANNLIGRMGLRDFVIHVTHGELVLRNNHYGKVLYENTVYEIDRYEGDDLILGKPIKWYKTKVNRRRI